MCLCKPILALFRFMWTLVCDNQLISFALLLLALLGVAGYVLYGHFFKEDDEARELREIASKCLLRAKRKRSRPRCGGSSKRSDFQECEGLAQEEGDGYKDQRQEGELKGVERLEELHGQEVNGWREGKNSGQNVAAMSSDRGIPHLRDIFGFSPGYRPGDIPAGPDPDRDSGSKGGDSKVPGHDSAISSIGSTSEDEQPKQVVNKKKKKRRDNSRTLTDRDVKHLERHLSMKKTIRKKIMRDLQTAFVEDPSEFRVEDISHEQLKAELNATSLNFNAKAGGKKTQTDPSFLDMLRGGSSAAPVPASTSGGGDDDDEDTRDIRKTSFWSRFTIKGRNKR